jgi:hypothetical protein
MLAIAAAALRKATVAYSRNYRTVFIIYDTSEERERAGCSGLPDAGDTGRGKAEAETWRKAEADIPVLYFDRLVTALRSRLFNSRRSPSNRSSSTTLPRLLGHTT